MEIESPRWFKSSHSAAETCCLEVTVSTAEVRVRDSRRPEGPIEFAAPEWMAFLVTTTRS
ncbi:DUF397 domain-containing protein [Nocardiopsis akebiae]|uniref:DUF397 domain-containing protein n=1 Tax=Nocardiopsis akebiae TaxID=2831968 RepID=A0ABX8CAY6_9ACTN|nr:DUF397 domain-containing protein [Nocardiopsis akebiae]QUX30178.1 DUF397 domain-containing protein [Nocardiopsis akebiae]